MAPNTNTRGRAPSINTSIPPRRPGSKAPPSARKPDQPIRPSDQTRNIDTSTQPEPARPLSTNPPIHTNPFAEPDDIAHRLQFMSPATPSLHRNHKTDDPKPIGDDGPEEEKQIYKQKVTEYTDEMYIAYKEVELDGQDFWNDFVTAFCPETVRQWTRATATKWVSLIKQKGINIKTSRDISRHDAIINILNWNEYDSSHNTDKNDGDEKNGEVISSLTIHDDDADDTKGNKPQQCTDNSDDKANSTLEDSDNSSTAIKDLGIQGLVRAYNHKEQYSGAWEEDIDACLETYEMLAQMCNVSEDEKLKAMPIMLKGDALTYFGRHCKKCTSFQEAVRNLKLWFNSEEKRARILNKWQTMSLAKAMEESPNSSEIDVFRTFTAKLTALQRQLDPSYHSDRFLRDRLLTAIDVSPIQKGLRDRVPATALEAINRVGTQLSEDPNSAGISTANLAANEQDEALYTLNQTYGGAARRNVRPYPNASRRGGNSRGNGYSRTRGRRLNPDWIRGARGCFVCNGDHRASDRHPRHEVTAAIRRLKEAQPTALLSVEDLSVIHDMWIDDDDVNDPDSVMWADDDQEVEEAFLASLTSDENMGTKVSEGLSNAAFAHSLAYASNLEESVSTIQHFIYQADENGFNGVHIDTCANRSSVMSYLQYKAYCLEFNLPQRIKCAKGRGIKGIGGLCEARGEADIQIPFPSLPLVIKVSFMILNDNIPSLLSMKDMITNGLDISLQKREITLGKARQKVDMENYFLIYRWKPRDMSYVMYSEQELRQIHKSFGHPSISAMEKLIKTASGKSLDVETRKAIETLNEECSSCRKYGEAPRRFKLTVGCEELAFNHSVQIDTMFINGKAVLHMVDEATHFTAATFLRRQSTNDIWKAIQNIWCQVYLGPPDMITVDQGTAYISNEMKENMSAAGITLKEAPIETPNTIGIVERYHAPLRKAYLRIREEMCRKTSDAECLSMAIYSVNTTIGPEGLCPTLMVFGAIPRPVRKGPSLSQLERMHAIEKAGKEAAQEQARRRISFGLRHTKGQTGKTDADLRKLPAGSKVMVYRTTSKTWEGPHTLIQVDGHTAVVQLDRGRRIFRSSSVRPVTKSELKEPETYLARPTKKADDDVHVDFTNARKKELAGLKECGIFEVIDTKDIPASTRIYGTRFVDSVKKNHEGTILKSRLVAQNYGDVSAAHIATKAPTVQRYAQRVLLCLAASYQDVKLFSRDVKQAYTQSETTLERDIFVRPPKEMALGSGKSLRVTKPLYGIPESGLHWFLTYQRYHTEHLGLRKSKADPCVFASSDPIHEPGSIVLQVDDSLGFGCESFMRKEDTGSKKFQTKPRIVIEGDQHCIFNGSRLDRHSNGDITMTQKDKLCKLSKPCSHDEFVSTRAAMQYIGVNTRPEICATTQLLATGAEESTEKDWKALAKVIDHLAESTDIGLKFVKLNLDTTKIMVFSDAAFANARDKKSQLGFVVSLVDDKGRANIVHFGSQRSRRVTRSVMAAELFALVLAFDNAIMVKQLVEEITGKRMALHTFIDSKTLFDVVAKNAMTQEKRLQIDIFGIRESYRTGEMNRLAWIPGRMNPADVLTKEGTGKSSPLWSLLTTNRLWTKEQGWGEVAIEGEIS